MTCGDTQNIIKNYESYVINWTRPLAQKLATASASVRLVRAPSVKLQAPSSKSLKPQATSLKPQATSVKLEATSYKLLDSGSFKKFQAPLIKALY